MSQYDLKESIQKIKTKSPFEFKENEKSKPRG